MLPTDTSSVTARPPAVVVRDLNHSFGHGASSGQVLFSANLTLMSGELAIMTGPSGSGKTTLLTLIGGLRRIQDGSIQVLGRELRGLTAAQLTGARREIGFIFQAHNLLESLTAHQNVQMAMQLHPYTRSETLHRAGQMLTRVGLSERLFHKPRELSIGQRQRVAIARALVNCPKLILADEPTAALDRESARNIIELLKDIARTDGATVLMVTHDNRIGDCADRIVNLVDGAIVSETEVEKTVSICEFLAKCPVFQQNREESITVGTPDREAVVLPNSPNLLSELARKMQRVKFAAGTTVFRQGDAGDKFYIVRDGQLDVVRETAGQSSVVGQLRAGDYFGEAALIRDTVRNATIHCTTGVTVYSLDTSDFLAALGDAGSFRQQIRNTLFSRQAASVRA